MSPERKKRRAKPAATTRRKPARGPRRHAAAKAAPTPIRSLRDWLATPDGLTDADLARLQQEIVAAPDPAWLDPLLDAIWRPGAAGPAARLLTMLAPHLPAGGDEGVDLRPMWRVIREFGVDAYLKAFFPHIPRPFLIRGLAHEGKGSAEAAAELLMHARWRPATEEDRAVVLDAALTGLRMGRDRSVAKALAAMRPGSAFDGAFIVAAAAGESAVARFLLSIAADAQAIDAEGCTALLRHLDRAACCRKLCDLLIRPGAVAAGRNAEGEGPLHVAARRGHDELVGKLLAAGADPRAIDRAGRTPLATARRARAPVALRHRLLDALGRRRLTPEAWAAACERQRVWVAAGHGGGRWIESRDGEWGYEPMPALPTGPEDLSFLELEGLPLKEITLEWADLHGASGAKRSFAGSRLAGCLWADGDFRGASFRGADLTRADFTRALLGECDFREANLSGAVFAGADLAGARLTDARLDGARITAEQLARTRRHRWRIECVKVREESVGGPDYDVEYEFRVVDERNDRVFRSFSRSVEEIFLAGHYGSGAKEVVLSPDGLDVIVRYEGDRPEERIRLPE